MSDEAGEGKINLRVDRLAAAMDAARARARGDAPPVAPSIQTSPDAAAPSAPVPQQRMPSTVERGPGPVALPPESASGLLDRDADMNTEVRDPDGGQNQSVPSITEDSSHEIEAPSAQDLRAAQSVDLAAADEQVEAVPIPEAAQDATTDTDLLIDTARDRPALDVPAIADPVAEVVSPDEDPSAPFDPAEQSVVKASHADTSGTSILTPADERADVDGAEPLLLTQEFAAPERTSQPVLSQSPGRAELASDISAPATPNAELEKVLLAAAAPIAPEPASPPQRRATWQRPIGPALLALDGVRTDIGRYHILSDVGFDVPSGAVTMLLGRNGVGKTTTLRTIMGLWRARAGSIRFAGEQIERWPSHRTARAGIGYVPESMSIFSDLTVAENITLGAVSGPVSQQRLDWLFSLFPQLATFWRVPAGNLSGGQKQMLALARALVEKRRLYLIDEPTKGLAPSVVSTVVSALRDLKLQGATILMVEQNFAVARALGDRCVVMDDGQVTWRGEMQELADDPGLQARLMGLTGDAA